MSSVKEERGSLFVRVDSQLRQVEISRILYVTGLKDYVMIYLEGEARPLITHVTMKAMEEDAVCRSLYAGTSFLYRGVG